MSVTGVAVQVASTASGGVAQLQIVELVLNENGLVGGLAHAVGRLHNVDHGEFNFWEFQIGNLILGVFNYFVKVIESHKNYGDVIG